jgi:hypothetical protein
MEKEKAFESMKNSLEYAKKVSQTKSGEKKKKKRWCCADTQEKKKALDIVKENPVFMFNVAFVQSELVSQILQLNENQRTVAGMEAAAKELDEAVQ